MRHGRSGKYILHITIFLIAQDLWRFFYQILSIIFLKEFIELNVNTNMIIKNMKLVELKISFASASLDKQILKMIQ